MEIVSIFFLTSLPPSKGMEWLVELNLLAVTNKRPDFRVPATEFSCDLVSCKWRCKIPDQKRRAGAGGRHVRQTLAAIARM